MKRQISIWCAAAFLAAMPSMADGKKKPSDEGRTPTAHRTGADADVTYGRVKELNRGQKVVIDVDDAIDKSFELTDKDRSVNLAADVKAGDPVRVTEREVNGRKTVLIEKHTGGNVQHGDPRSSRADRVDADADVTYGRIKEFQGGRILIDVDNAPDKEFEVADTDRRVNIAGGLKVGDPIKVTEREVNGKKTVQIVKHTGGNVRHGDADRKDDRRR